MPPRTVAPRRGRSRVPTAVRGRGRTRVVTPPPEYREDEPPVDQPPSHGRSVTISEEYFRDLLRGGGGHTDQAIPPVRAPAPVVDQSGVTDAAKTLKEYVRYNTPEFDGTSTDPADAERWITRIERVLGFIKCPDQLKVHCGTYSLVDDALYWWNGISHTLSPDLPVSWEMFREKFFLINTIPRIHETS